MLKISETRGIIFPEGRPTKLTFCLSKPAAKKEEESSDDYSTLFPCKANYVSALTHPQNDNVWISITLHVALFFQLGKQNLKHRRIPASTAVENQTVVHKH